MERKSEGERVEGGDTEDGHRWGVREKERSEKGVEL